jgi:hypothetical protein
MGLRTYFSNINKSTHEVLVAERVDGLLSLLPRSIFHNTGTMSISTPMSRESGTTDPHPYITRGQRPNPSIQRSFNSQKKNQKTIHIYV